MERSPHLDLENVGVGFSCSEFAEDDHFGKAKLYLGFQHHWSTPGEVVPGWFASSTSPSTDGTTDGYLDKYAQLIPGCGKKIWSFASWFSTVAVSTGMRGISGNSDNPTWEPRPEPSSRRDGTSGFRKSPKSHELTHHFYKTFSMYLNPSYESVSSCFIPVSLNQPVNPSRTIRVSGGWALQSEQTDSGLVPPGWCWGQMRLHCPGAARACQRWREGGAGPEKTPGCSRSRRRLEYGGFHKWRYPKWMVYKRKSNFS